MRMLRKCVAWCEPPHLSNVLGNLPRIRVPNELSYLSNDTFKLQHCADGRNWSPPLWRTVPAIRIAHFPQCAHVRANSCPSARNVVFYPQGQWSAASSLTRAAVGRLSN
jgi:hypothetical protein